MANLKGFIERQILESVRTKKTLLENVSIIDTIKNVSLMITKAYQNGGKTLIAGNIRSRPV